MKTVYRILFLFISLHSFAGDIDIIKLRELYYKASTNKGDAEKFYETTQTATGLSASLLSGYSGMSYMIKANFAFNPYYKLSYFTKGKSILGAAIDSDPKNVELRFLRYCVQSNAPAFLGYSSNLNEDKKVVLLGYITMEDKDLKKRIKEFMKASKYCTDYEKKIFTDN